MSKLRLIPAFEDFVAAGSTINEAAQPLPTGNESWGFYGTVSANNGRVAPVQAYRKMSKFVMDHAKLDPLTVRNFLDSTFGRHIADQFERDPEAAWRGAHGERMLKEFLKNYDPEMFEGWTWKGPDALVRPDFDQLARLADDLQRGLYDVGVSIKRDANYLSGNGSADLDKAFEDFEKSIEPQKKKLAAALKKWANSTATDGFAAK